MASENRLIFGPAMSTILEGQIQIAVMGSDLAIESTKVLCKNHASHQFAIARVSGDINPPARARLIYP